MFGHGSFQCWVEGISDLLQTVPVFPESGMNYSSSWRLSLSDKALALCTKVARTACSKDGDVIQHSGRGLCG
jgi:hypothetical protein